MEKFALSNDFFSNTQFITSSSPFFSSVKYTGKKEQPMKYKYWS